MATTVWQQEAKLMAEEIWNKFITDNMVTVEYSHAPVEIISKEQLAAINGEIITIETKAGKDMLFCIIKKQQDSTSPTKRVPLENYIVRPITSSNIAKVLGFEEEEENNKINFTRHLFKFPKLGIDVSNGIVGSVVKLKDGTYATITPGLIYK